MIVEIQISHKELREYYELNDDLVRADEKVPAMLDFLVLKFFKGIEKDKPFIIHLDNDLTNNDLSNLKWATHHEFYNFQDKYQQSLAALNPSYTPPPRQRTLHSKKNIQKLISNHLLLLEELEY